MKNLLILSISLFLNTSIFSQIEAVQIGGEFKQVMSNGGVNGIQTYSSGKVIGSQFFFPSWTGGSVTTKNNVVISKNFLFLYDKVRQELFIKQRDSTTILLAEKDQISSFSLNGDKTDNFVPASVYDPSDKINFFEVLTSNNKGYSLLKLVKAKFVKADQTDILRMKDGDIYDKFIDDISYYISYNNGLPQKIIFKEKNLEKALPLEKEKIADYYNNYDNKIKNDSFLKDLVESLNK